ncbi:MAG: HEAT repeat domain-containing protein [Planctomycetes bacterium]|nr:HEAT repeat domain-containing protein [Planctomycetota bacterium]
MRKASVLAIVFLSLARFSARAEDAPPTVEQLVEKLLSRFLEDREQAAAALVKLGKEAVPLVAPLAEDRDARVQRAAVEILGRIGTPESVRALLPLLDHADAGIRGSVRASFLRAGRACKPILRSEAEQNPAVKGEVEKLLVDLTVQDIEAVFRRQITSSGESGFYHGQYDDLKELGPDGVAVLTRMFTDPEFPFQDPAAPGYQYRQMAVDALGDVGDASVIPELVNMEDPSSRLGRGAAFTLYKLGHQEPVLKMEKDLRDGLAEADSQQQGRIWADLAEIAARVGEQDRAIEAYRNVIRLGHETYVVHYNLACAYSMKGMKAEAIAEMRRAKDAGYRNAEWIQLDRDLDGIRGEPEFRKILEELGPAPAPPGGGHSPAGPSD